MKTSLPAEIIRCLEKISQRVTVGFCPTKDFEALREIVSEVSEATARHKLVEILYQAASIGKKTIRKTDPYQVWAMKGGFYLTGLCQLRNSLRMFALERVKNLSVLDESFQFPEHFSLVEYMQTAFRIMRGDPKIVNVCFSPGAARVVRKCIWRPTQTVHEHEDGGSGITPEVPINYEVISWILGFRSAAEALQPVSLKKRIVEELEASLGRYRSRGIARTKIIPEKKVPATLSVSDTRPL